MLMPDGYFCDLVERQARLLKILNKRGNQQLENEFKKDNGVFIFPYRVIKSGKNLVRPINYNLLQVIGNETSEKSAIIFIDPKAGRSWGICGSKKSSQVGVALEMGHPVYVIAFEMEPCPNQKMTDVLVGTARLITEVVARHGGRKPVLVGNCQAGWMLAVTVARYLRGRGLAVLTNGTPLSYWSGQNPLKYLGLLMGGAWWISFLSDLNGGYFDGANLSLNFELKDASKVVLEKFFDFFTAPNTKIAEDLLKKENWWNTFCLLTKREISGLIRKLFTGNLLEQGRLEVEKEIVDLRDIERMIIFASHGDTITSPAEALCWIPARYTTTQEIAQRGNTIIYSIDKNCGHMGIFVSGKIAETRHREFFALAERIDSVAPGLYELVFKESGPTLESRTLDDIRALDHRSEKDKSFTEDFAAHSEFFTSTYECFISPWVRFFSPVTEFFMQPLNPMRWTRTVFSDFNFWMLLFKTMVPDGCEAPSKIENGYFKSLETSFQNQLVSAFTDYENWRNECLRRTAEGLA